MTLKKKKKKKRRARSKENKEEKRPKPGLQVPPGLQVLEGQKEKVGASIPMLVHQPRLVFNTSIP